MNVFTNIDDRNLSIAVRADSMDLWDYFNPLNRTCKFRFCKFARSYTTHNFCKPIRARYNGRANFNVN